MLQRLFRLLQFLLILYFLVQGLAAGFALFSTLVVYFWLRPTEGLERFWFAALGGVLAPLLLSLAFWLAAKWRFTIFRNTSLQTLLGAITCSIVLTTFILGYSLRLTDHRDDQQNPRVEIHRDDTFTGASQLRSTHYGLHESLETKRRNHLISAYWRGDDETGLIAATLILSFVVPWLTLNSLSQRRRTNKRLLTNDVASDQEIELH